MKNLFFCCFAILQIIACKPSISPTTPEKPAQSSTSNLPEAEQKALNLTATALSGEVSGSLSADGKALEINITNSAAMEQELDLLPLHSSRAAWVFYKNTGNDKPSYEKIVVRSHVQDTSITLEYPTRDLAIVKARLPIFEAAGNMLLKGDYAGLLGLFDPEVMKTMKPNALEQYCVQLEPKYGKPISFELRGFNFNKSSSGKEYLSLAGPLKRQIKDTALDIAIDLSKPGIQGTIAALKFDY
ncbi:MAG: hypothetical protein MUC59_06045 [Saprospiraceae bacterium]|nr:hypothetical protein [Saprospiraceae bacterium]